MKDNEPLPESKKQQIEQEALAAYPKLYYKAMQADLNEERRELWKEGATAEATKSLVLVEALEKIDEMTSKSFDDEPINIVAVTALDEYRKK